MTRSITFNIKQNEIDRLEVKIFGELRWTNGEPIFRVGENYVINNYTYKCVYIGETSIIFEPE